MFDPPITTTGTILESPKTNIYLVALPNGKQVIGHVPKALAHLHNQLTPNNTVTLELTPYDFSKARITAILSPDQPATIR